MWVFSSTADIVGSARDLLTQNLSLKLLLDPMLTLNGVGVAGAGEEAGTGPTTLDIVGLARDLLTQNLPLKLLLDPMLILNGAGVDGDGPIIAQFTGGPTTGAESRFELKT